jgi:preprotein translocase subunit SecG
MEQLIIILHLVAAVAIVALILLQQGRGADMGASFGAGSSQTVFGPAGSGSMLTRLTALLAAIFFATSFGLAIVARDKAAAVSGVDIDIPAAAQTEGLLKEVDTAAPPQDIPAAQDSAPAESAAEEIPE